MTYQYVCEKCRHSFDVVKSHHDMERNENCDKCGEFAVREFVPQRVHLVGTRVTHAEYNPGLGCVVKSKAHLKDICKQKGVEEIGNEKPETIHKHFDSMREAKREEAWEKADRGWVGKEDGGSVV